MVVLDTCAIIELSKNDVALSSKTLKQIQAGAYILSASFAEIGCKIKSGKLDIGVSASVLYHHFVQIPAIEIIKIGVAEWLESIELDWGYNKDPVDRLIVSFAQAKKIPVVTSDKKIEEFYSHVIW